MRALPSTVVAVLGVLWLGTHALADQPIAGAKLLVKDSPDVTKRKVQFASSDPNVHVSGGVFDFIYVDFQIFNSSGTGESECWHPAGENWTYAAERPNAGFKSGSPHPENCTGRINQGLFRIKCTARTFPITYSLDEPQQGSMGVVVRVQDTAGSTTYCTDFGGTIVRDSALRHAFIARAAPVPVTCPIPPASCP